MTLSVPTGRAVDLRVKPVDEILDRVERSLQTSCDRDSVVRKRRSVGARTDRDTWVRIERRHFDKINAQGWNGTESAARLAGVSQPAWQGCVVWPDTDEATMWRADETALLPGDPIGTAVLSEDPQLADAWWRAFNGLVGRPCGTEHEPGRHAGHRGHHARPRYGGPSWARSSAAFSTPTLSFDSNVEQWVPAHADLNWANMTAPTFCLFDWEDWGNAPRGLDSASLWASSLAVPALADRVRQERHVDFASRNGRLMTLFACSKILGPDAHPQDPRLEPARQMVEETVQDLQSD